MSATRYPCCGHCRAGRLPEGHQGGCGYHLCAGNTPLPMPEDTTDPAVAIWSQVLADKIGA